MSLLHLGNDEETVCVFVCLFFKNILFIYLFIFRQRGREGERKGEKHPCVVASRTPHTGEPGLQSKDVPQLGIEPATLWFTGWHSIH